MDSHSFNVLSLCSGVGGLDLGIRGAIPNARTVCYVEREISCCKILAARMQDGLLDDAPIWTDLDTFDGRPWRGVVDCIVAGIPCQGNSLAGNRKLEADPRNKWPQTRRIIREVGPRYFILENVYGILVPGDGVPAPIVRILGELAEDGFDAEWCVLPASAVGASQRRERVFVLAVNNIGGRLRKRLRLSKRGSQQAVSDLHWSSGSLPLAEHSSIGSGEDAAQSPRVDGQSDGDGEHVGVSDNTRSQRRSVCRSKREGKRTSWPGDRQFPPGPGFGLDRVARGVLDALESGEVAADDRFLAELAQWAAWQRILAERPDLAPAVEPGVRDVAHGAARGVDISRTDKLRALGNGVVPQCAAAAIRELMGRM